MAQLNRHRLPDFVAMVVATIAVVLFAGCGDGASSGSAGSIAGAPPPTSHAPSCGSSSAIGLLLQSKDVVAYVPKGAWYLQHQGVARVQLEGSSSLPSALIDTPQVVNSCAANSASGKTVCIANETDIYIIADAGIQETLTSDGSGEARFSLGVCTNCTVVFDAIHNAATIGLVVANAPAYQTVELASGAPQLDPPVMAPSRRLGEGLAIDAKRKLLLAPNEGDNFELAAWAPPATPSFFENQVATLGSNELEGVAEDCSTGIAVVPDELTGDLFLTDLNRATFTPNQPSGTWTAPSQLQALPDLSDTITRMGGIAIAQGSHFGAVAGEIAGNQLGAFQLPATSGTGSPAVADWVACGIPDDPSGEPWAMGLDPDPLNAYVSPNTGHAIAVLANSPPTYLALVDLTEMINAATLPRTIGTHSCSASTLPAALVTFVPIPS